MKSLLKSHIFKTLHTLSETYDERIPWWEFEYDWELVGGSLIDPQLFFQQLKVKQ